MPHSSTSSRPPLAHRSSTSNTATTSTSTTSHSHHTSSTASTNTTSHTRTTTPPTSPEDLPPTVSLSAPLPKGAAPPLTSPSLTAFATPASSPPSINSPRPARKLRKSAVAPSAWSDPIVTTHGTGIVAGVLGLGMGKVMRSLSWKSLRRANASTGDLPRVQPEPDFEPEEERHEEERKSSDTAEIKAEEERNPYVQQRWAPRMRVAKQEEREEDERDALFIQPRRAPPPVPPSTTNAEPPPPPLTAPAEDTDSKSSSDSKSLRRLSMHVPHPHYPYPHPAKPVVERPGAMKALVKLRDRDGRRSGESGHVRAKSATDPLSTGTKKPLVDTSVPPFAPPRTPTPSNATTATPQTPPPPVPPIPSLPPGAGKPGAAPSRIADLLQSPKQTVAKPVLAPITTTPAPDSTAKREPKLSTSTSYTTASRSSGASGETLRAVAPPPTIPEDYPPHASPTRKRAKVDGMTPFPETARAETSSLKRVSLSSRSLPDALKRAFSMRGADKEEVPPVPALPEGLQSGGTVKRKERKESGKEKEGDSEMEKRPRLKRSSTVGAGMEYLVARMAAASSPTPAPPPAARPPLPPIPASPAKSIHTAKKLFKRPRTSSDPRKPAALAGAQRPPTPSAPASPHPPPLPHASNTHPPPVPHLPLPSHMVPKPLSTSPPRQPQTQQPPYTGGGVDLRALAFTGFTASPEEEEDEEWGAAGGVDEAAKRLSTPSRARPKMVRGTSDLRRWTLADFPDDVSFLRALGRRAQSESGHGGGGVESDDGHAMSDELGSEWVPPEREWWRENGGDGGDAGRALLCVREIAHTEESYRRRLEGMYASSQHPLPASFTTHLPELILASSHLSRRLADDPSAWGAAAALLGCEDEMERALVGWSAVVGEVVWGVSAAVGGGKKAKNMNRAWAEEVREVAVMPTQRVPRYVLMYRELLHYTPPSSPSRPLVERALEGALRIATRCDAAQRHRDSALPPVSSSAALSPTSPKSRSSNRTSPSFAHSMFLPQSTRPVTVLTA